jgi:hypothetical protein
MSMGWKWPTDDAGRYKRPEGMDGAEKVKMADLVAGAIEDGGPSPGADFLAWAKETFGFATNLALLGALLGGRDPDAYLERHWQEQVDASRTKGLS